MNSSPPKSADDVVGARARAHYLPEHAQDFVTNSVAEAVVDRLEVLEIEHQYRHRLFAPGLCRTQHVRVSEEGAVPSDDQCTRRYGKRARGGP